MKRRDFINLLKASYAAVSPIGAHPAIKWTHTGPDVMRNMCETWSSMMDHDFKFNIALAIEDAVDEFFSEQVPIGAKSYDYNAVQPR